MRYIIERTSYIFEEATKDKFYKVYKDYEDINNPIERLYEIAREYEHYDFAEVTLEDGHIFKLQLYVWEEEDDCKVAYPIDYVTVVPEASILDRQRKAIKLGTINNNGDEEMPF